MEEKSEPTTKADLETDGDSITEMPNRNQNGPLLAKIFTGSQTRGAAGSLSAPLVGAVPIGVPMHIVAATQANSAPRLRRLWK